MQKRREENPMIRRVALVLLIPAIVLSACGSNSTPTPAGAAGNGGGSDYLATAKARMDASLKGTNTMPDTTSRPPATGKKVVVISGGQSALSSSVPSDAAVEAAKAIGWDVSLYDQKLDPTNATALIRQALAGGANGIVLDATDCPFAKQALQEAKTKGVKVVPIYAFDCSDPIFGAGGESLFSGIINYGKKASDIDAFTKSYGADQADAIIAATGGKAQVVLFNDSEFTVLKYTAAGFKEELAKCGGCKIVAEVDFKAAELGPNLQQKAQSILLQHPEANAVKIPYTAAALLGISPAVVASGRKDKLYVMGGEGFAPELDLLRTGKGVNAVNIVASDWTGWAAVDTLNSLFNGQPPADSGLGWQLADKDHNLPASGPFVPAIDFKAAYKKAWGK
jgi:ribose transport system substrate-binding protein